MSVAAGYEPEDRSGRDWTRRNERPDHRGKRYSQSPYRPNDWRGRGNWGRGGASAQRAGFQQRGNSPGGRSNYGSKFNPNGARWRSPTPNPAGDRRRGDFGRGNGPTQVTVVSRSLEDQESGLENYQVFEKVSVEDEDVENCLADTSASRTILSLDVYSCLENKPPLQQWPRNEHLLGVGGGELHPKGIAVLKFEAGPHLFYHPETVTGDMAYPMIIGMDTLRAHEVSITLGDPD